MVLIAAVGVFAYLRTFDSPFMIDDIHYIVENPTVRDLGYFFSPSEEKALGYYDAVNRRFVGYLTFALNYRLHGFNVTGFHIVNTYIHLLNAVLVYFLVVLTFRTPFLSPPHIPPLAKGGNVGVTIALFSALLFVSHPVQTEAVIYVYQRFALLATLFYLLSLVLYIKWRLSSLGHSGLSGISLPIPNSRKDSRQAGMTARQSILYLASLLCAVLAMKTKENAFTLPLMITLYEFLFFRGPVWPRLLRLIPLLLTLAIIPLSVAGGPMQALSGAAAAAGAFISPGDYLLTEFSVVVTYIRLLFLPVNQNINYDYPVYISFREPPVLLSFIFLLSVFLFALWLVYRSKSGEPALRLMGFGVLWFFIALSVESSIFQIPVVISEYRVYLPSAGFFPAVASGAFLLLSRLRWKKAALSALACILLALMYATYARSAVWESDLSLWEDVVKKSPKRSFGHNNLGNSYYARGMTDKALERYQTAVRLDPRLPDAHYGLGNVYLAKGMPENALEHYRIAIEIEPYFADAHNGMGNAFFSKGMPEEAIERYIFAGRLKPDSPEIHHNLGAAYAAKGDRDRACAEFQIALEIKPDYKEAMESMEGVCTPR